MSKKLRYRKSEKKIKESEVRIPGDQFSNIQIIYAIALPFYLLEF